MKHFDVPEMPSRSTKELSKALLVMDMPDKCRDCRLWERRYTQSVDYYGTDYCHAQITKEIKCDIYVSKPDDCPLVLMPIRQEVPDFVNDEYLKDLMVSCVKGWNACLDRIEGDNDEWKNGYYQ